MTATAALKQFIDRRVDASPLLAGAAGIGAFALPLAAPGFLGVVLIAALAFALAGAPRLRLTSGALAIVALWLVLNGTLSAPLTAAMLAAAALVGRQTALALAVLALQTSGAATAEHLLADYLAGVGLEASGPGVLSSLVGLTAAPRFVLAAGTSALATLGLAHAALTLSVPPGFTLALSAMPCVILGGRIALDQDPKWTWTIPGLLMGALVAGWLATPPRLGESPAYYIMPNAPDLYEAKLFDGWEAVLPAVGVPLHRATSLDEIPDGAMLLLPWVTAPFAAESDPVMTRLRDVARRKRLTVILVGEHTNYGDVVERINSAVRGVRLRNDLTTPPGNSDGSGPLRSADGRAWPHQALINRGASVEVTSPFARILLTGDGWWTEPNIGEWLWVGDYVWSPGDRQGRVTLAAAADDGGARWVVVGDNSLLVDRQMAADPRPVLRLLELATLRPAFVTDISLLLVSFLLAWRSRNSFLYSVSALAVALAPHLVSTAFEPTPSAKWSASFVSASSFNERTIAAALADEPRLPASGWTFSVRRGTATGHLALEDRQVQFAIVEGEAEIAGVRLSECWRLGSLRVQDGVTLMDAQACRIDGEAEVLIGERTSAAAFAVRTDAGTQVVVLDPIFIGARAPVANRSWLADVLDRINRGKQ